MFQFQFLKFFFHQLLWLLVGGFEVWTGKQQQHCCSDSQFEHASKKLKTLSSEASKLCYMGWWIEYLIITHQKLEKFDIIYIYYLFIYLFKNK
jgi:hypothetical protein